MHSILISTGVILVLIFKYYYRYIYFIHSLTCTRSIGSLFIKTLIKIIPTIINKINYQLTLLILKQFHIILI